MRRIIVLSILCVAIQVNSVSVPLRELDLMPDEEQQQSGESDLDIVGITETYDQTTQEEILIKLNVSNSDKEEFDGVNCASDVTKMKRKVVAFRAKMMADATKVKELTDLIAAYEAQIDANVAATAEQLEQIVYLNNTITYYKNSSHDKDEELADLQVRVSIDEAKLKQNEDLLAEYKERLVNAEATSCLTYGNSSEIQILKVPGIGPFMAPCESRYLGSGWTVIQRRFDGSVDFNRNWIEYRNGFGNLDGEFFIGLEKLYRMTTAQPHELLIYYETFYRETNNVKFTTFVVGSEEEDYALKHAQTYNNYNSPLYYNIGEKFSTYDRDNDNYWFGNCAKEFKGGWWFNSCQSLSKFCNFNGQYKNSFNMVNGQGIILNDQSLKSVQMMIRPN